MTPTTALIRLCTVCVATQLVELYGSSNTLSICIHLWSQFNEAGEDLLRHSVTADETWSRDYEPDSRRQGIQVYCQKETQNAGAVNVLLTIIWDSQGQLLGQCQERTVRSAPSRLALRAHIAPSIAFPLPH